MEKQQYNTNSLRAKIRERRRKIKKLIIRRKEDFLTALDKNWRDWLFRPLTHFFHKIGVKANHISYAGFILIAITIFLYFNKKPIEWQLIFIVLATLSDMIDGPAARNNNNVTVLGTWLDHIRDYTLVAWVTFLLYAHGLLGLELIAILWLLQFILVWILTKDFFIQYLKGLPGEEEEKMFIDGFSLDNLQASIIGRLQFSFWITGYILLIINLIWPNSSLVAAGHSLLVLAIIFAALNIYESYQKTLPK